MITTSSAIIAVSLLTAYMEPPSDQRRKPDASCEKIRCDYIFLLMTRKVPSTTEKQIVMAQRVLSSLRNMLVFSIGIDELERNQNISVLQRVIRQAFDPLAKAFFSSDIANQTYILLDRTNVTLHKTGTNLEITGALKNIQDRFSLQHIAIWANKN